MSSNVSIKREKEKKKEKTVLLSLSGANPCLLYKCFKFLLLGYTHVTRVLHYSCSSSALHMEHPSHSFGKARLYLSTLALIDFEKRIFNLGKGHFHIVLSQPKFHSSTFTLEKCA